MLYDLLREFYAKIIPILNELSVDEIFVTDSSKFKLHMKTSLMVGQTNIPFSSDPNVQSIRRSFFLDNLIMNEDVIKKIGNDINREQFMRIMREF